MFSDATLTHLRDIRARLFRVAGVLLVSIGILYAFKEMLLGALLAPLLHSPFAPHAVIYTAVSDLFFVYVKVCAWGGVFLAFPYFLWEAWRFLKPGLYPRERGGLWPMMLAVPSLFYAGGVVALFVVVPLALRFFLGFEQPGLVAQPNLTDYLSFVLTTMFAFGGAFNLPIFLVFFMYLGLLTPEGLAANRRFVVVGIFAVSAVLTPPDPLSQCALALPLMLLYEGAIFWGKVIRGREVF